MNEQANTLRQLIMGFRCTQLIYVAAKLGVADRLAAGPKSTEDLATEVAAEPEALYRLLRALASLGVFTETSDRVFALTGIGGLLRTNAAGSLCSIAMLYGENWLWQAYGNMLFSVQTGRSAFENTHGLSFYDFLDHRPAAAALFQAAMSSFSEQEARAILQAYDFSNLETIVDVGAGHGVLLAAIIQKYPGLSGIAFDVPAVAGDAQRLFARSGLALRASFIGGDFFRELPGGRDLYLLKSVLHNWDDDAVARILGVCRRAISHHGRLLVIERVIPPGNGESEAKLFDINMLVTVGGRERSKREYEVLLARANFALSRIIPTSSPLTIIEASPS